MSTLGNPLYLDSPKRTTDRLSFAPCCARIVIKDELKNEVIFQYGTQKFVQPVVYEWKPKRCLKCPIFGHLEGQYTPPHFLQCCQRKPQEADALKKVTNRMIVAKRKKNKEVSLLRTTSLLQ